MDKREEERPPFNERAALEELERFKSDIERYRQQRKAVGEAFDHFVGSFKKPSSPAPQPPLPATAPRHEAPPRAATPPSPARVEPPAMPLPPQAGRDVPLGAARADSPRPDAVRVEPQQPVSRPHEPERMTAARAHGTSAGPSRVVILALLLLAAGVAAWYFWPQPATDSAMLPPAAGAATSPAPGPAPVDPPAQQTPAPAPAAAAPPVPSTETVLTTTRLAWVRVIADGQKIFERELPAGSRIPLKVGQTLEIRTGDAGAVNLVLNGKDLGPLGTEGQVITRRFTVTQ
jgi:hypothetical protein